MITSFFSASNWRDLYEIFFNELKRVEIETGIFVFHKCFLLIKHCLEEYSIKSHINKIFYYIFTIV